MARSRNIKPGFFKNDILAEIEPLGRILFAGLWTIADREGRLKNRPKRIKAEVLPYDDCDIEKLLQDLEDGGFIQTYEFAECKYIQILNFLKHQNPHKNESPSEIPAPEEYSTSTVQVPEDNSTNPADSLNPITDSLNPTYVEIINYLNEKTGKSFSPNTKKTQEFINGRIADGYTLDDFKAVIDKKVAAWQGKKNNNGESMENYLRPSTLFRPANFESYLNEKENSMEVADFEIE